MAAKMDVDLVDGLKLENLTLDDAPSKGNGSMEEEEEEETLQEQVFGDKEIFKEIAKYLNLWDLKTCRRVNSEWNESAVDIFRERTFVVWDSYRRFDDFVDMMASLNQKTLLPFPFRDLEFHMEEIPNASKLQIMSWFLSQKGFFSLIRYSFFLGQESSVRWLEQHKPTIKELIIFDSEYAGQPGDSFLRNFNFPVLEKIILNLGVPREPGKPTPGMCHLMNIMLSFLNSSPNLRTLSVVSSFGYDHDVLILDRILSRLQSSSQIQHLNLYFQQPTEKHLQLLAKLQVPPLKSLTLYLKDLENTAEPIFNLVHSSNSAASLQRLNLFHASKPSKSLVIPSCALVTELQLPTFTIGTDLSFLLHFPALRSLKVRSVRIRNDMIQRPSLVTTPFLALQQLHVYGAKDSFCKSADAMDWLMQKFPSVTSWGFKYKALAAFSQAFTERKEALSPVPVVQELKVGCWSNMEIFADEHELLPKQQNLDMDVDSVERRAKALNLSALACFSELTRLWLDEYKYWSVRTVPFQRLRNLKAIHIYWGPKINVRALQRKLHGCNLERIYVMNCCLCRRHMTWSSGPWFELADFFEEIPIATCGCASKGSEDLIRGFLPILPAEEPPEAGPFEDPNLETGGDSGSELPDI